MNVYCISGIDTDCGKSVVTGLIARFLLEKGENVITQKAIQTGCVGISEDILTHRKLMKKELYGVDKSGFTCPFVFPLPASPHLAAAEVAREFDEVSLDQATMELSLRFDKVILEGAGGVYVPLKRDLPFIDYIKDRDYPLIIVTSSKLGSINHTLLTLEAAANRGIKIAGLVYNHHFDKEPKITADSKTIFSEYLVKLGYPDVIVDLESFDEENPVLPDFSPLFK